MEFPAEVAAALRNLPALLLRLEPPPRGYEHISPIPEDLFGECKLTLDVLARFDGTACSRDGIRVRSGECEALRLIVSALRTAIAPNVGAPILSHNDLEREIALARKGLDLLVPLLSTSTGQALTPNQDDWLGRLDQYAAMVSMTKNGLREYPDLPSPDVKGRGQGKHNLWYAKTMIPFLERHWPKLEDKVRKTIAFLVASEREKLAK